MARSHAPTRRPLTPLPPRLLTGYRSGAAGYVLRALVTPVLAVRVARVVSAIDGARILNEKTATSQIIGGTVGGIGMALLEETVTEPGHRPHRQRQPRRLPRPGQRRRPRAGGDLRRRARPIQPDRGQGDRRAPRPRPCRRRAGRCWKRWRAWAAAPSSACWPPPASRPAWWTRRWHPPSMRASWWQSPGHVARRAVVPGAAGGGGRGVPHDRTAVPCRGGHSPRLSRRPGGCFSPMWRNPRIPVNPQTRHRRPRTPIPPLAS